MATAHIATVRGFAGRPYRTLRTEHRDRFRFFLAHAGYSSPPGRVPCAAALARAEHWAEYTDGIDYLIEDDTDTDLGDHEYWCHNARSVDRLSRTEMRRYGVESCAHRGVLVALIRHVECETCGHRREYEILETLGSIIDPSPEYLRVVKAELASQYMDREGIR